MRLAIAQINYHIGNFEDNTKKIINFIEQAKAKGARLIVFPELAIGGYLAKDMFRYASFLDACEKSAADIAAACYGIACIIGAPVRNPEPNAKQLFNAALFMADGEIRQVVHKTLLPDYDVFDEYRYFEPNHVFQPISYEGLDIALTICEDLWNRYLPNLYQQDPMKELAANGAGLMINIAASPFSEGHFEARKAVVRKQIDQYHLPAFYVNTIGAHTDIVFDGRSMVFDAQGALLDVLHEFEEDLRYYEVENGTVKAVDQPAGHLYEEGEPIRLIHKALVLGIRDFFRKSGFNKAVLGLSGGIDSAVVAALAGEALGADQVMAVLMPSVYSSEHSVKDAMDLVHSLGCLHEIIPIKKAAAVFDELMAPAFQGKAADLTEENIQARLRAVMLMAMSNKHGYILLNTSNKSEAAVGYGTLYGDMAGALSVIGDVFKTKVYELARYINRDNIIIPENTIIKAPSAELRPDQKDSDSLPEYDVLDAILHYYIELEWSADQIVAQGYARDLVARVIQLVTRAEFKRFQTPPILRVTRKAFGQGRAMPLVARYVF